MPEKKITTRTAKYREKFENHPVMAIILTVLFLLSTFSGVISYGGRIVNYFTEKPSPLEQELKKLTAKGCLIFLSDGGQVQSNPEYLMEAYKDYWRSVDLFYASEIRVVGHVHHRGSSAYNQSLSAQRASAAVRFLEEHARLSDVYSAVTTIGLGELVPLERYGEFECGAVVYRGES
jgi:hypothetical protein